jgi:broad-specificity NMP kinase
MIIMINGSFGVGKTTAANLLQSRISNSMIFDPELVGFMLREIITEDIKLPDEQTDNFQDLLPWKVLVVKTAEALIELYGKHLIVPMAIYNRKYFRHIYEGLKSIDKQTYHFCLVAKRETIHGRLRSRGEDEGNWCYLQAEKCIEAFQDPLFENRIQTDGLSPKEIVAIIAKSIG